MGNREGHRSIPRDLHVCREGVVHCRVAGGVGVVEDVDEEREGVAQKREKGGVVLKAHGPDAVTRRLSHPAIRDCDALHHARSKHIHLSSSVLSLRFERIACSGWEGGVEGRMRAYLGSKINYVIESTQRKKHF